MIVCDLNRPWGDRKAAPTAASACRRVPTGALAEKGFAVEEMVKQDRNVTRLAASAEECQA